MISKHRLPLLYQVLTTHIQVPVSKSFAAPLSGSILLSTSSVSSYNLAYPQLILLHSGILKNVVAIVRAAHRALKSISLGGCERVEDRAREGLEVRDRERLETVGARSGELYLYDVMGNKSRQIHKALEFWRGLKQ